jgi:hypothetical protein
MWFIIFPHPFSFSSREKPPAQQPPKGFWIPIVALAVLGESAEFFHWLGLLH